MRAFLELYPEGGRGMLRGELFAVLEGSSFSGKPTKNSDTVDAITSSLVIVSFLLNSFEAAESHYAMAEGWFILAACIARYAARNAILPDPWRDSLELVMAELEANLALLRKNASIGQTSSKVTFAPMAASCWGLGRRSCWARLPVTSCFPPGRGKRIDHR